MTDQAAGLRQWAAKSKSVESTPLQVDSELEHVVVLGLPALDKTQTLRAVEVFQRWAEQGKKWVGDSNRWRIIPVASDYPDLAELVKPYPRWALWIDQDLDSFQRAYEALKAVHRAQGPKRMIALNPPLQSRRGLLSHVQQVAKAYFDIDLLVFSG